MADDVKADIPVWREATGQTFVWAGGIGGVLTIVDGWSNVIAPAESMRWAVDDFSHAMHLLFSLAASPLGLTLSKKASITLSFLTFYIILMAGSLLLERANSNYLPKINNFVRLLAVSYIVWPAIFLFSIAMRIVTFTDKSFTMIVFLCSIALCHILINSLVVIDIEILGLILLFLMANLGALDQIRDVIFGADFIFSGSYKRAVLEVVLTVALVMVLLFPAVLAAGNVFRKSLGVLILSAGILLGVSAASQFDVSKISVSDFFNCCELRPPWPVHHDDPPSS